MKPGLVNEYKKKIPGLDSIKITKEAFQKMNLYAGIASEIKGSDIECLGALLNYKSRNDNAVRDIYLWDQQRVTPSEGRGEGDDFAETNKRGMSVIGFWHSHGYNDVFHSGKDEGYLRLKYNLGRFKNRIVTGEKCKNLEYVMDGETVRLFEEGSSKEIRIKGKIEDVSYVELEQYDVLNSIVINRNSYSGGFANPRLHHDYDAEVWAGYDKNVKGCYGYDDKRCPEYGKKEYASKEYKRFKHVQLELVDETNNIQLDEEELVKEVGEKVRLDGGPYLKDLPNYPKVLEKCKKIKDAKYGNIEEIVNPKEKTEGKTGLTSEVQKQISEPIKQEAGHDQGLYGTKTYMEKLEEFYDTLNSRNDTADKMLAELCRAYSGKEEWFWTKRYEKGNEILKKLKKNNLTLEQKTALENIKSVVESNKYLKRNYPSLFKDITRRLNSKNSNSHCTIAYLKDRLFYRPQRKKQKETLENKLYTRSKARKALKIAALSAGIAVLTAALALIPEEYKPKEDIAYEKPAIVYTVKKGDTLWGLTKDYLKEKGAVVDNAQLYKAVDEVAEENGKGKQAEYSIGGKEKKNPHYIKPGQKIKFSEKILNYIKKGGRK